jgi:hypothetical protein
LGIWAAVALLSGAGLLLGACKDEGGSTGTPDRSPAKARLERFWSCVDEAKKKARPEEQRFLISRCVSEGKLFGRSDCNRVWKAAETGAPEEQARLIAAGCGQLYCPHLSAPKPGICAELEKVAREDVTIPRERWRRLFDAILRAELGGAVTDATRERTLRTLASALVFPDRARPRRPGRLRPGRAAPRVGRPGEGKVRRVSDPGFVIRVSPDGKLRLGDAEAAVSQQALLTRMKGAPQSARDRGVLIHVARGAPKARVIRLFDLLKQAGITRFAVKMGGK